MSFSVKRPTDMTVDEQLDQVRTMKGTPSEDWIVERMLGTSWRSAKLLAPLVSTHRPWHCDSDMALVNQYIASAQDATTRTYYQSLLNDLKATKECLH